jgi:HK97 family phage portal protein
MSESNWYNTTRVSQPGSVILNEWRDSRRIQNSQEPVTDLTPQELANLLSSGMTGSGGPAVNETTAMRVSAVYACVSLIAGAIATLPLQVFQRTADGRGELVEHDYWWLLNERPNDAMSAAVFWECMVVANLFKGDAFAHILRPSMRSQRVNGLVAYHPDRVNPFLHDGRVLYRMQPVVGPQFVLDSADVLHIPSLGFDGLRSPSPITYAARQAVSTALAAGEYNGRFFSNGARPDFALKTAGKLDVEAAKVLRATWMERHGGTGNSHLPAILTGGMEIEQLSLSAEDSQVLNTSLFQIEEIARVLGVPPFMIGHTDKATSFGTGVENMGRGFNRFTLSRHLVKYKQELNFKLWPTKSDYFVKHDVTELESGDIKSENESLRITLGRAGEPGWMTQNEVRHIKNLPPLPDGNDLFKGTKANDTTSKTADGKSAST